MDEPRDPRVQSNVGLIAKAGVGLVPVQVTPGRRLDLPSASPLPHCRHEPQHSHHPPRALHLVSALPQGGGDLCVPAGSHGWRHRTARCWASASPRAPCWRRPWALCTTTLSTGRTPRTSTLRGEYCPPKRAGGGVSVRIGGSGQGTET